MILELRQASVPSGYIAVEIEKRVCRPAAPDQELLSVGILPVKTSFSATLSEGLFPGDQQDQLVVAEVFEPRLTTAAVASVARPWAVSSERIK